MTNFVAEPGSGKISICDADPIAIQCTHVDKHSDSLSCGTCSELDKLNGNIDEIKCALEQAIEQRRTYFRSINRKHDPIQRLPVELITAIFILCLPRPHSLEIFSVGHASQDHIAVRPIQFLLGSICRYWRQVVWSTPQLWNTLWLHASARTSTTQNELLTDSLARSCHLPLYIGMFYIQEIDHVDSAYNTPAWLSVIEMINNLRLHINRIKVLHLRLLGRHIRYFAQSKVGTDSPYSILERLSLEVVEQKADLHDVYFIGLCDPKPTELFFKGISPPLLSVDWGGITTIEAQELNLDHAVMVLQLASQLHQLKVSIRKTKKIVLERVTHHSLRILDIIDDYTVNFLHHLTCPVLEELTYYCSHTLPAFLSRSACSLRKLNLETLGGGSENLLTSLRLTPLLTHLTLKDFGVPDELSTMFAELSYFSQSNSKTGLFLPQLQSFICNGVRFSQFRWTKIPLLISKSTLFEVKITFENEADFKDEQHVMDRKSLVQTLKLVQHRGMVLKVQDSKGIDLIRWSELFHEII